MRWTPKRKFELVRKYRGGRIREVSELLIRFSISMEEFNSWLSRFELMGIDGLKVTKTARSP
jgi:hypothetical protein